MAVAIWRSWRVGPDVEDRRLRSAAGVDRQAAVRLVAVDEIALRPAQQAVPAVRNRAHHIDPVRIEIAEPDHARQPVDVAAALLGDVRQAGHADALEVLFGDVVDHPADRIGAVNRRSPVLEHFDPVDRGERDLVDVNCAARETVRRDPPPVEQDQRRGRALPAQVGRRHPVGAALRAAGDVGVGRQVVCARAVGSEEHVQLLGAGNPVALERLVGDDFERDRALGRVLLEP